MRWTKVLLQSSVLNMNYSSGAHNIIASHLHVQRTMLMLIVCSIIFIGTRKYWAATVVDIAGELCHWDQFSNMTNLFLCLIDWMKQMEISTLNVSQVWWWWIQYFLVMWKLSHFFMLTGSDFDIDHVCLDPPKLTFEYFIVYQDTASIPRSLQISFYIKDCILYMS